MSASQRRTFLMLGVIGLAAVVGADRMGWLPTGASAGEPQEAALNARSVYQAAVESSLHDQAILDAASTTSASLARAKEQWSRIKQRCITGKTAELAEAGFRERVLAATKDLGITNANAAPVRLDAAVEPSKPVDAAVRPIALRVQFDTDKPQDVYRVVDVLENLPDIRATVTQVSINGPGLPQVPTQITASITLRAIAVVGEGD